MSSIEVDRGRGKSLKRPEKANTPIIMSALQKIGKSLARSLDVALPLLFASSALAQHERLPLPRIE